MHPATQITRNNSFLPPEAERNKRSLLWSCCLNSEAPTVLNAWTEYRFILQRKKEHCSSNFCCNFPCFLERESWTLIRLFWLLTGSYQRQCSKISIYPLPLQEGEGPRQACCDGEDADEGKAAVWSKPNTPFPSILQTATEESFPVDSKKGMGKQSSGSRLNAISNRAPSHCKSYWKL